MKFHTSEAVNIHHNKYAKIDGFLIKISYSKNSAGDKQKDKYLFALCATSLTRICSPDRLPSKDVCEKNRCNMGGNLFC